MDVNTQVQCGTESLDQRYRTSMRAAFLGQLLLKHRVKRDVCYKYHGSAGEISSHWHAVLVMARRNSLKARRGERKRRFQQEPFREIRIPLEPVRII